MNALIAYLKDTRQRLLQNIVAPSWPSALELLRLLSPFGRDRHTRLQSAAVIIARVQLLSLVFALLVPLFALLDFWVFDLATAARLAGLRLLAGALFALLAWPRELSQRYPYLQAVTMLLVMLLTPVLFFVAAIQAIDSSTLNNIQHLLLTLYGLLPTLALAGLAIFPLSALEVLLLSLPVLSTALWGLQATGDTLFITTHGAILWFMAMMIGVAMISGMSQSHYMNSLIHQASTDPLTGAYTRRAGIVALNDAMEHARRQSWPLAVAFFDIDHFKQINDQFGHDAGDLALQELVTHLRRHLRYGDSLICWGGEEFVLVLPGIAASELPGFLTRLRDTGLGHRPDGLALIASAGLAEREADRLDSWPELVNLADQRLYKAKKRGRACAVLPDGGVFHFVDHGLAAVARGHEPQP